jgi:hypothetical protein
MKLLNGGGFNVASLVLEDEFMDDMYYPHSAYRSNNYVLE